MFYSCYSILFIPYLYMAVFFLRKPIEYDYLVEVSHKKMIIFSSLFLIKSLQVLIFNLTFAVYYYSSTLRLKK